MYAKVVFGLPLKSPFDYSIPPELSQLVFPGSRVKVNFGTRLKTGYVVALSQKAMVSRTKPLLKVLDRIPLIDSVLLELTRKLSQYYCCSWGEAIESALPAQLRGSRQTQEQATAQHPVRQEHDRQSEHLTLVHSPDPVQLWEYYLERINLNFQAGKSTLIVSPEYQHCLMVKELISKRLGLESLVLSRGEKDELDSWFAIRSGKARVVIGTRSAIFSPLVNPGLAIIDQEQESAYKQEQPPHYHARDSLAMRAAIEGFPVLIGSIAPTLESYYQAKKGRSAYVFLEPGNRDTEIKFIPRIGAVRPKEVIPRYVQDNIAAVLARKARALVFLNRSGFARRTFCQSCGKSLKCPRCESNLVFYHKGSTLRCRLCGYNIGLPDICPYCNASYIKFSGFGTEKLESELYRLFPQAKISLAGRGFNPGLSSLPDILVVSGGLSALADLYFTGISSGCQEIPALFELTAALGMDDFLNFSDFRSGERAYQRLMSLYGLTSMRMIIQTDVSDHHVFEAIQKKQPEIFYARELSQRKELSFPPCAHLIKLGIRGKKEAVVESYSRTFQNVLKKEIAGDEDKTEVIASAPGQPPKLRGNFHWQLMIRSRNMARLRECLEKSLNSSRRSGIIVTVDVDPIL